MKRKDIKQAVKEYFFTNPTAKLRVREIERTLKLPLPSVIRYCRELEKEEILSIVKIGNVNFYAANRASEKYRLEKEIDSQATKQMDEINNIKESKENEIRQV